MARVLVTRPLPAGHRTAQALRRLGHQPIVAPLFDCQTITTDGGDATAFANARALVFTSARAMKALGSQPINRSLPVFTVGAATATAAQKAGFSHVTAGTGGWQDLAARIIADLSEPASGPILHLAGEQAVGDLAGVLGAAGFAYHRQVVYRMQPVDRLPDHAVTALSDGGIDWVLLFSPRAGHAFASLLVQAGLAGCADRLRLACLSPAVAQTIAQSPWGPWAGVRVADQPTQSALLRILPAGE